MLAASDVALADGAPNGHALLVIKHSAAAAAIHRKT